MKDRSADLNLLKKACEQLGEHFDSVQIFVTRHEAYESDGTVNIAYGEGNWFSRYGQVVDWIVRKDEQTRKDERE